MGIIEVLVAIISIILLCLWGIYEDNRKKTHNKFINNLNKFDAKNKK